MQNAYEFLNKTFRSEKGEKKFFFGKLNIDIAFLDRYILVITTIKIFTC